MEFASRGVGHAMRNVCSRRVRLHRLPTLAVVKLHPVVFAILDFASVLEGLGEEVAEIFVVWCVFETKVADIAQVLVEFLCQDVSTVADACGGR